MVLKNLVKIILEQILQPVAKKILDLNFIVSHKWKIKSLDIKSAFLQGQPINREIFLKPPKKAGTDKLWKLLITVYGLRDAPRAWYLRIKEVLEKSGMLKSKFDVIFYCLSNRKLKGLLCCHVDDLSGVALSTLRNK